MRRPLVILTLVIGGRAAEPLITLSYPVLGALFPPALTGRVHTALNFLVFVSAFAMQWVFGVVVEAWTQSIGVEAAYDVALSGLVGLQIAGYAWYILWRPGQSRASAE